MVAGIGAKLAKLLLWIFTFALWIAGLALVIVGAIVLADQESYTDIFGSSNIKVLAGVTLGLGCYAFLVGFAGCRGTCNEATGWLKVYWALTLIIILAEIAVGIVALIYNDEIYDSMSKNLYNTIQKDYGNATATNAVIDSLQHESNCCGSYNYTDWATAQNWNEAGKAVPITCCISQADDCNNGTKGDPTYLTLIHENGCSQAAADAVESNYLLIGIICLCLVVFEILTMIFTCCVISAIENGEDFK